MSHYQWIRKGLQARLDAEIKSGLELWHSGFAAIGGADSLASSLPEIRQVISLVDYTRLESSDCAASMALFLSQINNQLPPAGVCVFPRWLAQVSEFRKTQNLSFKLATVVGSFPHGQNNLSQKCAEVQSVAGEVDELDFVIDRAPLLDFMNALASSGELCQVGLEEFCQEIRSIRKAAGSKFLKVILETSDINSPLALYHVTRLLAELGVDMVKTSTGKTGEGAVPQKVIPILSALKDHHQELLAKGSENKWHIGLKLSGKIADWNQVQGFKALFKAYAPNEEMRAQIFRIGASQLYTKLLLASQ